MCHSTGISERNSSQYSGKDGKPSTSAIVTRLLRNESKVEVVVMAKELGLRINDCEGEAGDDLSIADEKSVPASDSNMNIVGWDGPDDPDHPMNFTPAKKWSLTIITALITFSVSLASSVFSKATFTREQSLMSVLK